MEQAAMESSFGVTSKRCSKCGKEQPLKEFYRDPKSKDGYSYHCRACQREAARERRRRKKMEQKNATPEKRTNGVDDKLATLADFLIECSQCGRALSLVSRKEVLYREHVRKDDGSILCASCALKEWGIK